MEEPDTVSEFLAKRTELPKQLAARQAAIDAWMSEHPNVTADTATSPELADLLSRVFLSRDALKELADLDDALLASLHRQG